MEVIVERCAALDVHKDTIMAAVRLPGDKGKRRTEVREFRTWTSSLRELRSWLVGHGVTQVAMEATGVYWKPPWHVLAPEPSFELLLVNAQHVKNLPGRKTDLLTELPQEILQLSNPEPFSGSPGRAKIGRSQSSDAVDNTSSAAVDRAAQ